MQICSFYIKLQIQFWYAIVKTISELWSQIIKGIFWKTSANKQQQCVLYIISTIWEDLYTGICILDFVLSLSKGDVQRQSNWFIPDPFLSGGHIQVIGLDHGG